MNLRPAPQQPAVSATSSGWARTWAVALLVGCVAAAGSWWFQQRTSHGDGPSVEHIRAVASRLRAAGVLGEAARMYEVALQNSHLTPAARGTQSYALGLLYLEDHKYEPALRWLYEADALGGGGDEVGAKIVHTLERLGRTNAAQAALAEQSRLHTHAEAAERPSDDPVVAELGDTPIVRSEVTRAMDDLPPEMAKAYKGSKGRAEFLHKYVADTLLWRKAQRLEYDRDADVQRRVQLAERQLAVAKLLDKDVFSHVSIPPSEVKTYFEAHADLFKKAPLESVKAQIEQTLRIQKSQDMVQGWVQKESTDTHVKLFADRMGGAP